MNPKYTKMFRPFLALAVVAGLSACSSNVPAQYSNDFDTTSRAAPVGTDLGSSIDQTPIESNVNILSDVTVKAVNVNVPERLRVSEANRFYPGGDIVWREDPIGDRHEQVKTIVHAGILQGVTDFEGSRAVELDIIVTRFHALTEKARYTTGGVHSIQFTLRVRDAETGVVLAGPKQIVADFSALGGRAAIQAEANGITQKVRITNQLANVIRQELTKDGGYIAQENGFIGALNQI